MVFFKVLLKKGLKKLPFYQKIFARKYYRTIDDLIIWNFYKIIETNDLRYLLKLNDYYELPEKNIPENLSEIWDKIYCEYLDTFGISNTYKAYLKMQKNLVILEYEKTIDKSLENTYERAKIDMERKKPKENKLSFDEQTAELEMFLKMTIDTKNISVKSYFTKLKIMENRINEKNAEIKRQKK